MSDLNWNDPKLAKYDVECEVPPMFTDGPVYRFIDSYRLNPSRRIYLKNSGEAGRGVFAAEDIKSGEIVEESPYILIREEMVDPVLGTYVFGGPPGYDMLRCIVLGYGSLFNHSYSPNVFPSRCDENSMIVFFANRDIKKDEELTFDYAPEVALDANNSNLGPEQRDDNSEDSGLLSPTRSGDSSG